MPHRVAAIDIGTNSVLLLIAECAGDGPRALVERATITRLGEGVDVSRQLAAPAVERTLECLQSYAQEIAQASVDAIEIVGTSAMRDAHGGAAFCDEAERAIGVRPRVISGAEEALLTFHGALSGLPEAATSDALCVFDIGGGSTEVIHGMKTSSGLQLSDRSSLDIGSVRLTERLLRSDPPSEAELAALIAEVDSQLARLSPPSANATLVGVAGTVTTLAALSLSLEGYDPDLIHGSTLTLSAVDSQATRLSQMSIAERRAIPGLHPKRADVIAAGALIAREILTWANADACVVSDRGVRWGLINTLCHR